MHNPFTHHEGPLCLAALDNHLAAHSWGSHSADHPAVDTWCAALSGPLEFVSNVFCGKVKEVHELRLGDRAKCGLEHAAFVTRSTTCRGLAAHSARRSTVRTSVPSGRAKRQRPKLEKKESAAAGTPASVGRRTSMEERTQTQET